MNATNLAICTMPGCFTQWEWVDGIPVEDGNGKQAFPWELCDDCKESANAAAIALAKAGILPPDEVQWCIEAARARRQRMLKLEALKKA